MTRPATVLIDLAALRANLRRVRVLAPRSRIMAIIKADAYGHGLGRVAHALAGVDAFGVACLEEAQSLREAGIEAPVVLLEGPFDADEFTAMKDHGLDMMLHQPKQLRWLERSGPLDRQGIWLKIDTGMHRLGFQPEELPRVWRRLQAAGCRPQQLYLSTHLASANEHNDAAVRAQLDCFDRCTQDYAAARCIANSAGILGWPDSHRDWVRPGLMLYGVSPFQDIDAASQGLRPVMSLQSELIAVRRVRAGEAVGYGATWTCPEDMPVGVAAIGYGDGYPRHAVSGTPVLVNGRRAALIGRPSMDMLTLDLRTVADADIGDPVTLWGDGLAVEEVAGHAGTIAYELLCNVGRRARMVYRDREGDG